MKKLLTFVLAASMVLGAVAQANAITTAVSGVFDQAFMYTNNDNFSKEAEDNFQAQQRFRINGQFIANDNLKAVIELEFGKVMWGDRSNNNGGGLDTDGTGLNKLRYSYINWNIPQTKVNISMGLQQLTLPKGAFGNPVFDASVAGIIASTKFNNEIGLTAFWARPFYDAKYAGKNNEGDLFGFILPMDFKVAKVQPWFVYGQLGANSGVGSYLDADDPVAIDKSLKMYVLGAALEFKPIDKLNVKIDGMWGKSKDDKDTVNQGYMFDAHASYKMAWGTPGAMFWYASGDKKKKKYDGRMPVLGTDAGWSPTRMAFAGAVSGTAKDGWLNSTGLGTAGIGAEIADLSFLPKLSHTARIAYIIGTNSKYYRKTSSAPDFMTSKDYAIEIGFDSKYQIYDNLAAYFELGYMLLELDNKDRQNAYKKNATSAQVTFRYAF